MESLRLEKTPKVVESNFSLAMLGIPGAEVPELGGGSKAGHQSSQILDLVSFMFLDHLIIHLNFWVVKLLWDEGWDPNLRSTGHKIIAFFYKTMGNVQNRK